MVFLWPRGKVFLLYGIANVQVTRLPILDGNY